jgi:glyoxylase-like metal-dependent hydrolase (beta-lactamase superfamily II)
MTPAPGILSWILFHVFIGTKDFEFPAFEPSRDLTDGMTLDIAGGVEVVHTPGHSADHVSLLWKHDRGVLFAGDVAANIMGLGYSLGYEDFDQGRGSLRKLADLDFEVAVFGHGKPILSSASARFAKKFG